MSSAGTTSLMSADEPRRQLLARHAAGDLSAFAELMSLFRNQMMALILRSGVAREAADDVFQDVFIKIHLAADRYAPSRPLDPWIYAIAQNTIRTHFRMRKVRQIVETREEVPELVGTETAAGLLDARETAAWLNRAIAKLPEAQREAVCLCGVKDLSQNDVAEILNIPVNTVKTNLSRGRAALAKSLACRNAAARREASI